jgi:hypothetical protein
MAARMRGKIDSFAIILISKHTNPRGFSPQAKYTDRATADCRRS